MPFCTECGTSVPDNVKLCTKCGKPVSTAGPVPAAADAAVPTLEASPPPVAPSPPPVYAPPSHNPPPYQAPAGAPPGSPYAVMTTGGYVGLMILFALPVVGWLICVVMAFAAGNLNRRNFARAVLILTIIGLVLGGILYLLSFWFLGSFIDSLTGWTSGYWY